MMGMGIGSDLQQLPDQALVPLAARLRGFFLQIAPRGGGYGFADGHPGGRRTHESSLEN